MDGRSKVDAVKRKPLLCLDFDGVLHSFGDRYRGNSILNDPPVTGAIPFIFESLRFFRIAVFGNRSMTESGRDLMRMWLFRWCSEANYLGGEWWLSIEWPIHKPNAFLSIDDRAITFTGTFPDPVKLLAFESWEEQKAKS
jgi:hypothetical protein